MLFLSLLTIAVSAVAAAPASTINHISKNAPRQAVIPSTFKWKSTGPLIGPKDDGTNWASVKDPSIVYHGGKYHVFASTGQEAGYNMVYLSFTDFASAGNATFHYLSDTPIGPGYRAAPEVFYFEPQKLWYLVFQDGNAAYSTNEDISNPAGWSPIKNFYPGMPTIISENIGEGYWVDMWVICDSENCHLFSSDDNGHLYRSQTSISDFPNGMSEPVIALEDERYALFEAANVYYIGSNTYLLLVEAIGSDGNRYFRSWTSSSIAGPWTGLADSEANPFARSNNVVFEGEGEPWTKSISHGEVIRDKVDQTLTIRPCEIRYLYQGIDPKADGSYNSLPWRLALLEQLDSKCEG